MWRISGKIATRVDELGVDLFNLSAQYLSILANNLTPPVDAAGALLFQVALDKPRIVAVGHKANLVALRLLSHRQFHINGHLADLGLRRIPQRKQ